MAILIELFKHVARSDAMTMSVNVARPYNLPEWGIKFIKVYL